MLENVESWAIIGTFVILILSLLAKVLIDNVLLKARVKQLEKEAEEADWSRGAIYKRLGIIERNIARIGTKMGVALETET